MFMKWSVPTLWKCDNNKNILKFLFSHLPVLFPPVLLFPCIVHYYGRMVTEQEVEVKRKGKVFPVLLFLTEHKSWGRIGGGVVPRIIDLDTRWRWVVYPQGNCPLNRRLGGPQSRSGRGGEDKNSQSLPGFEPPIIQPAALHCTTELPCSYCRLPLNKRGRKNVPWGGVIKV
jgi:hypothetical protein